MPNSEIKPNVVLLRPPVVFHKRALTNEATPALGLAYIAGYLRKNGYDTLLIDCMGEGLNNIWTPSGYPDLRCQGLNFEDAVKRMPHDTSVICITVMFSGEWPIVRELISHVRKHFPDALIIAGGEHITALPEYCLRDCPALNLVVMGEGERKCYEAIEAHRKNSPLTELDGIGFINEDDTFVLTSDASKRIRDIDTIPWPVWPPGYLEKFWAAGKSFGPQSPRDMPMMFSRGCPYQCTFCSNPQMWTTRYVLRNVDDVISEVQHYIQKYDITAVQLYDLTAIVKKRWILELLEKLVQNDIKIQWDFPSGTRSEILDEEVLTLLKKTGTSYLCYAPESGSPRMLKLIKKKIHLDRMIRSMKIAKKLGLTVRANTIIGFPRETRGDILRTLFFGLRCTAFGVDEFQPYIYMPYPGSELFDELVDSGQLTVNDDYFLSLTGLNTDLTSLSPITFNEFVGSKELALYRLAFTILGFGLGYLLRPSRIIRTLRNVVAKDHAATVFEHRLKDLINRRKEATP